MKFDLENLTNEQLERAIKDKEPYALQEGPAQYIFISELNQLMGEMERRKREQGCIPKKKWWIFSWL